MQIAKTIIIISTQVDATIREYQPDVEFEIFKTIEDFGNYLDTTPIRAKTLYFTQDVIGATNSSFSYIKNLVLDNDYLNVDEVVYITKEDAPEIASLKYLIDENNLSNWEIVTGSMSRAFITDVINGTFRDDVLRVKYKAVYRRPRADYVASQLRKKDSLDADYLTDEEYLGAIPDEPIPSLDVEKEVSKLKKVIIAGDATLERTAFAYLAAQYISLNSKVLLVESDPEYHLITEITTKCPVKAKTIDIDYFYTDPIKILKSLHDCEENLVIFRCINKFPFDYNFLVELLFYNLDTCFDYILVENKITDVPYNTNYICVIPSRIIDILKIAADFDRVFLPYTTFVGISTDTLQSIELNSGAVIASILSDLLSSSGIECSLLTITSLKLNEQAYDFNTLFKGVL